MTFEQRCLINICRMKACQYKTEAKNNNSKKKIKLKLSCIFYRTTTCDLLFHGGKSHDFYTRSHTYLKFQAHILKMARYIKSLAHSSKYDTISALLFFSFHIERFHKYFVLNHSIKKYIKKRCLCKKSFL